MTDQEALLLMTDGAFQEQEEATGKLQRAKQNATLHEFRHTYCTRLLEIGTDIMTKNLMGTPISRGQGDT